MTVNSSPKLGPKPSPRLTFKVPPKVAAPLMLTWSNWVPAVAPSTLRLKAPAAVWVYVPTMLSVPAVLPRSISPALVRSPLTVPGPERLPPLMLIETPVAPSVPEARDVTPAVCVKLVPAPPGANVLPLSTTTVPALVKAPAVVKFAAVFNGESAGGGVGQEGSQGLAGARILIELGAGSTELDVGRIGADAGADQIQGAGCRRPARCRR